MNISKSIRYFVKFYFIRNIFPKFYNINILKNYVLELKKNTEKIVDPNALIKNLLIN